MDDGIITTFNEEDFRAILNDIKAHMITASTYGFDSYYDCLMDAGHAIEQLRKERDAAVDDIPHQCFYCKKAISCGEIKGTCKEWEWRGLHD